MSSEVYQNCTKKSQRCNIKKKPVQFWTGSGNQCLSFNKIVTLKNQFRLGKKNSPSVMVLVSPLRNSLTTPLNFPFTKVGLISVI